MLVYRTFGYRRRLRPSAPGDSSGVRRRPDSFGLRSLLQTTWAYQKSHRPVGMVPRTCAQLSTVRAELILVSPRLRKRPRRRVVDTIVISQAGKGPWHLLDARAFFILTLGFAAA